MLRQVPGHGVREAIVDVMAEAGLAEDLTLMVRLIGQTLDIELTVPHHTTPRSGLIEVVTACMRYQGGMFALVHVVGFMRPGSPECERIRQLVHRPRVLDLLPASEQKRLREWLTDVAPPRLAELVRRAGGTGAPAPPQLHSAWEAFSHLADFCADTDGFPPAFTFLELVGYHLGGELRERLIEWNDFQARRLRLEAQLKARRATLAVPSSEGTRLHLMILVDHDAIDPGRYQVSHWCQEVPEEWPPPSGGTAGVPAADLERYVDSLVVAAERTWSEHRGSVGIEFVLPRALLSLPVHLWHREHESGAPRPLSVDYLIVVRSLERMRSRHWHRLWHMHWDKLMVDPAATRVYFENGSDTSRLDVILSDPEWGLVVLGAAPAPEPGGKADSLTAALRSGVPAVLWHPDAPLDLLREVVAEFTKGDGLGDLPMQAKDSRLAALEDSSPLLENLMRDLVVLWDDPGRLAVFDQSPGFPRQRGETADERERAS